ncbi:MAG: UDP-N-acetylmuramoyl-tripeptide--D-alanyl-D-alanine ligase [Candidatus Nitrotoga sp.]
MMLLSQAAQVLGCELVGHDVLFTSVSSDSRTINAGDLFVALQGENYDGAAFVASATQSGAVAALVKTTSYRGVESPCPLLLVEDTRLALGRLAAHWRAQFKIPVIAVTGSNGKTTVKEMLASILRAATGDGGAVLATLGNLNNDIGVPLTLLKLRAMHRYAVIEMGMNHMGEIEYLTRLARPDVAIVNNAGSAHLAGLGSVDAVARAKGEIFIGLSPQGTAVINADDAYAPLWRELADDHTIIEFGLEKNVAVHAQWQVKDYGVHIEVNMPQGSFSAQLQVPGEHNVRNALAATAAALALHVPLPAIVEGLEKFFGVAARLQRKAALHGAMLIDDSYNANPASLHAALEVLAQSIGKKILVLGDMGELGEDAARLHGEIGAEALRLGVNQLLALGKLTPHAVHEFGSGARHFERIEDLFALLDKNLDADSTVLVKGSRFMRMERVVQHCTGTNKEKEERSKEGSIHKLHQISNPLNRPAERNKNVT